MSQKGAKIMAILALIGIIISIIGTTILYIVEKNNIEEQNKTITEEELKKLLEEYNKEKQNGTGIIINTGNINTGTIETSSGSLN
ncbi:hypothetical protein DLH72_00460 [Candidatus Gracilibacteria bacterium]|nr:MAG: hypothetical protein DLH72_00460 [Candidatus Gracilibacteria bacterium]